jgi:twitching motility protein PilT
MELKSLLATLLKHNSSDLHLVTGQPPIFRTDGSLKRQDGEALTDTEIEGLLFPYLAPEQQQTLREAKQGVDITIRENGRAFRCQAFLERGRLGASIRVIPLGPPSLEDLELLELMQPILQSKPGLVLVTGHSGSGKSVTSAAILETLNRTVERRIFTLEDPIEYELVSKKCVITQHAVGEDVASYEQGARMVLRADPDIVFIGEMRTLEALSWAMMLADTGHLVFTILHTANATETLRRIIDAFPEPQQDHIRRTLARTLAAIISQRLLPRANRPGRVAANEILLATPPIRRMIAEGQTDVTMAIAAGRDQGMQTMDDSVLAHYRNGTISYDTAWYTLSDRERLGRPTEETQ